VSSASGSARPAGPVARTVSLVTLGCARNEVDSEELAARLTASGWDLTSADEASVVLVPMASASAPTSVRTPEAVQFLRMYAYKPGANVLPDEFAGKSNVADVPPDATENDSSSETRPFAFTLLTPSTDWIRAKARFETR